MTPVPVDPVKNTNIATGPFNGPKHTKRKALEKSLQGYKNIIFR